MPEEVPNNAIAKPGKTNYIQSNSKGNKNCSPTPNSDLLLKKKNTAQKLLNEFNEYANKSSEYLEKYKNAENDEIKKQLFNDYRYYTVMASDRANGIISVYKPFIDQNQLKRIYAEKEEINGKLMPSTVYTGYSSEGIHIIALAQPLITGNLGFSDTMNRIRGVKGEAVFLEEFMLLPKKAYYVLDLYVEDLMYSRNDFKVDDITVMDRTAGTSVHPIEKPVDDDLNKLLIKYDRKLDNSKSLKNKTWKLFLFDNDGGTAFPDIFVSYQNEYIDLKQ